MKTISILIIGLLLSACHHSRVKTPGVVLTKIPGQKLPVAVFDDISELALAYRDQGSSEVFVFNPLKRKKNESTEGASMASQAFHQTTTSYDQVEGYCDRTVTLNKDIDGQFVLSRKPGRIAAARVGKQAHKGEGGETDGVLQQGGTAGLPTNDRGALAAGITPVSTRLVAVGDSPNTQGLIPLPGLKRALPITLICPEKNNPCALSTDINGVIQAGCGGGYTHLSPPQIVSDQPADCRSINPETDEPFATNYDVAVAACKFSGYHTGIGQPGLKRPDNLVDEFHKIHPSGATAGTSEAACDSDGTNF